MSDPISRTALAVAAGRAIGLHGLNDPLTERFMTHIQRQAVRRLRTLVNQGRTGELATSVMTAGLNAHATLRMAAIDAAATAAIEDGAGQVVTVGAGFDTRAWRLDAMGGIRVVEVDLPAIQQVKRGRMADLEPIADVSFVPADLASRDLDEVLTGTGHAPDIPTTWIWEAVAPYLPAAAVRTTLAAISTRSAPGSHLIMTYMLPHVLGDNLLSKLANPAARMLFSALGEPLLSAYSDQEMTDLANELGWSGAQSSGANEWAITANRPPSPSAFSAERLLSCRMP